jgi:hypothetical protein
MCDYSLRGVRSRPAKVGDKLMTKNFGTGTTGFASVSDHSTAVCVLPGTELAFSDEVRHSEGALWPVIREWFGGTARARYKTAIFRQINKGKDFTHHDALEFPDGQIVLLTRLWERQQVTILQFPAEPRTPKRQRTNSANRLSHRRILWPRDIGRPLTRQS